MFTTRTWKPTVSEPTLKTMSCIISDSHRVSETAWNISLVQKPNTEHAFLVLQGLKNDEPFLLRSDLFLDTSHCKSIAKALPCWLEKPIESLLTHSTSFHGSAFIRLKELKYEELEEIDGFNYQSYPITADQALKLIKKLMEEAQRKSISYNLPGDHPVFSASYSGSEYHNCISWCENILKEYAGITISGSWKRIIKRPSEVVKHAVEEANCIGRSTQHSAF